MKKAILATAAAAAATFATPAAADAIYAVTPTGQAETWFAGDAQQVSGAIANACIETGAGVANATPVSVVCETRTDFGTALAAQLLMGNSYSTAPKTYLQFTIAQINDVTRVQARASTQVQSAFGQDRSENLMNANLYNLAMDMMRFAGGEAPEGTIYPNHAWLGAHGAFVSEPNRGALITDLLPDSAAARASLQEGDIIRRIAGKRIKNSNNWYDGIERAAKSDSYEVEFWREGERQKATLDLEFRAEEMGLVLESFDDQLEQEEVLTQAPQHSVADELVKLADLLDRGLITDAEFDEQKRRLFGAAS